MTIQVTCRCGQSLRAPDEYRGRTAACPKCRAQVMIQTDIPSGVGPPLNRSSTPTIGSADKSSTAELQESILQLTQVIAERTRQGSLDGEQASRSARLEYKVLTHKDKWFSGKFDPERLEQALNAYAAQGWHVKGIATASFPSLVGNREELVVVLER